MMHARDVFDDEDLAPRYADDPEPLSSAPSMAWHGAERPQITPGEYSARCTGFQGPMLVRQFGVWKVRLEFVLDPDDHLVSCFFALGQDKKNLHIGQRSKYWKAWVRANGSPPRQGQDMSPGVFVNESLVYTVKVSNATKDGKNPVEEKALAYSRIDDILSIRSIEK
jgi:hypothetical protein